MWWRRHGWWECIAYKSTIRLRCHRTHCDFPNVLCYWSTFAKWSIFLGAVLSRDQKMLWWFGDRICLTGDAQTTQERQRKIDPNSTKFMHKIWNGNSKLGYHMHKRSLENNSSRMCFCAEPLFRVRNFCLTLITAATLPNCLPEVWSLSLCQSSGMWSEQNANYAGD